MNRKELMEKRQRMLAGLNDSLLKGHTPEDSPFYYHPGEDRIVLSHALFWVMTRSLEKVHSGNKCFLLLRQYEEEMLDAYLTDSEEFPELLRYCNILYEAFPLVLNTLVKSASNDKPVRKLMAISVVAGGFGGDMPDDLANELLDDMDFSYNKVCCRKIERMSPLLNKMVEKELEDMEEYY